ncbi:MAG: MFS transporter, partial [Anaerovoracaceae bacterium]
SQGQISILYLMYAVAGIVMVPVITAIMNKIGKRELFIIVAAISAIGALIFYIVGINSQIMAILYIVLIFSLFAGVFWTVYVTFAYDIAEIYEYKYGQRCDGSIVAIVDLSYKLGAAIASFLSGALLAASGYVEGGAIQTPEVLDGINAICTLPAVITFTLAGIIVFMYPMTKEKYNALADAIAARKEGREHDPSKIDSLLK